MRTPSRWLNWTPNGRPIMEPSPKMEPTKPTKPSFDGFDGSLPKESPIIRGGDSAPSVPAAECPYCLPEGVKLVRYTQKTPPVAITVCSVVNDPDKFIRHALEELAARLHHPVQIKANDSVFELLSKLADCGLEVRIDWNPQGQIIDGFLETEPTKPSKTPEPSKLNVHGLEITDEDLPF